MEPTVSIMWLLVVSALGAGLSPDAAAARGALAASEAFSTVRSHAEAPRRFVMIGSASAEVTDARALSLSPSAAAPAADVSQCVKVTADPRFRGYGYDHVVVIDNGCATPVRCEVSTNVDPASVNVELAAGAKAEVVTRRGSPASTFVPIVQCSAAS